MFAKAIREDLSDLPEMRDLMVALQRLPSFAPTWLELLHSVITLRGARSETALTANQLARITQPVQLIWGEDDPFGPPEVGERAAQIIPDAELHVIPGGHGPWLSEAERVGQLATPFLRKHA
jgi:pimeloyl-ACP methyl ester carboxylesterase